MHGELADKDMHMTFLCIYGTDKLEGVSTSRRKPP